MKFSSTILCAALLIASQAEAANKIKCHVKPDTMGMEGGSLAIFTRDPHVDRNTGETVTAPSAVFSFWRDLEPMSMYSVKIFNDVLAEGDSCYNASSIAFDLGEFDSSNADHNDAMKYRVARDDIPSLLNVTVANGMIGALVDEEGEIAACCILGPTEHQKPDY